MPLAVDQQQLIRIERGLWVCRDGNGRGEGGFSVAGHFGLVGFSGFVVASVVAGASVAFMQWLSFRGCADAAVDISAVLGFQRLF